MINRGTYYFARSLERVGKLSHARTVYRRLAKEPSKADAKTLYRLGHILFNQEEYEKARFYIHQAVEKSPAVPEWHYRLGFIDEKTGALEDAERNYRNALALRANSAQWHYRLGKVLSGLGKHEEASNSYQLAVEYDTDESSYHEALAKSIRSQSATSWRELEVLQGGAALHGSDAEWQLRLAQVLESLNRFEEAADAFAKAVELQPDRAFLHYRLGYALQQAGDYPTSERVYERAIEQDTKLGAKALGIGVFHEARNLWHPAVTEYLKTEKIHNTAPSALLDRIARCYEKLSLWNEAKEYRSKLVQSDPNPILPHLKLARMLECTGDEQEAITAYAYVFGRGAKISRYWRLRYARLLQRHELFELAALQFLIAAGKIGESSDIRTADINDRSVVSKSNNTGATTDELSKADIRFASSIEDYAARLIEDSADHALRSRDSSSLTKVAEFARKHGNMDRAEQLSMEAYFHDDNCSNETAINYAMDLYCNGNYEASCSIVAAAPMARQRNDIHTVKGNPTGQWATKVIEYYYFRDNLPLAEDVVLYESHMGASIDCNPYAIYRELSSRPEFHNMHHVWVVSPDCHVPADVANDLRVRLVRYNSSLYRRYLATAKYLINNVTFQNYFIRRDEQKYLNTWHGKPMKTLGKDMGGTPLQHANVSRNFLQSTHILSPDSHTTRVLTRGYDVDGIITAKVAELGYPRYELGLNLAGDRRREILDLLEIDPTSNRPVVLYAPTWRGEVGESKLEIERLQHDLGKLATANATVLFRAHPISEQLLTGLEYDVTVVPRSVNSNELLAVIDALITDYSSIAFDAMALNIPVYLYTYDIEEYRQERGLYFEPHQLSELVYSTIGALVESVNSLSRLAPGGLKAGSKCNPEVSFSSDLLDGNSSKRAVDFLFNEDQQYSVVSPPDERTDVLIRASLIPNGVTSSLLNLLHQLDPQQFSVTLLVDASVTAADEARLAKFDELPSHVRVIGRIGPRIAQESEKWQESLLSHQHNLWSEHSWDLYMDSFEREYARIFGDSQFDFVIEYDGYSLFWASLLASAMPKKRSLIYLHSEMHQEWMTRAAYLEGIFRMYSRFDGLVCVSEEIAAVNAKDLADVYELDERMFIGGGNFLNLESVLSESRVPMDDDIEQWLNGHSYLLTVGRISPEKDQIKLVKAFRSLAANYPEVRLLVVGDGPQYDALDSLIRSLGLESRVYLAGYRSNPFSAMKNSSGFVLSSNHEGQPMVLLEALAMDIPVVSTDIPGARSMLGDTLGLLVDNSVQGLAKGMEDLILGNIEQSGFDFTLYNRRLYDKFISSILGLDLK